MESLVRSASLCQRNGSSEDETPDNQDATLTPSHPLGHEISGIVSFVESHTLMYIQELSGKTWMTRQALLMNLYYSKDFKDIRGLPQMPQTSSQPLTLEKIGVGTGVWGEGVKKPMVYCAAPDLADGYFYRAELLERVSPTKIKVKYVDYGNCGTMESSFLMELPGVFRTRPPGCFKCRIRGGFPDSLPLDYIKEAVEGTQVLARLEEVNQDPELLSIIPYLVDDDKERNLKDVIVKRWEDEKPVSQTRRS